MPGIEGGLAAAGRSSGRDRVWAGQAVPGEVIAAGACGAGGHADQVAAEGGAAGPGVKQRGQRPDGAQDVLGDRGQDGPEGPVECAPVVSAAPTALAHRTPCSERCRRASSEVLPGVPNGGYACGSPQAGWSHSASETDARFVCLAGVRHGFAWPPRTGAALLVLPASRTPSVRGVLDVPHRGMTGSLEKRRIRRPGEAFRRDTAGRLRVPAARRR